MITSKDLWIGVVVLIIMYLYLWAVVSGALSAFMSWLAGS